MSAKTIKKATHLVIDAICQMRAKSGYTVKEILRIIEANQKDGIDRQMERNVVTALKRGEQFGFLKANHGRYILKVTPTSAILNGRKGLTEEDPEECFHFQKGRMAKQKSKRSSKGRNGMKKNKRRSHRKGSASMCKRSRSRRTKSRSSGRRHRRSHSSRKSSRSSRRKSRSASRRNHCVSKSRRRSTKYRSRLARHSGRCVTKSRKRRASRKSRSSKRISRKNKRSSSKCKCRCGKMRRKRVVKLMKKGKRCTTNNDNDQTVDLGVKSLSESQ